MESNTQKIDRYILNEMSPEEKAAFEQEMKANPALRKEYEMQKDLTDALKTMGVKADLGRALHKVQLMKTLTLYAVILIVVAGAAGLVFFLLNDTKKEQGMEAFKEVDVPVQKMVLLANQDTVIETEGGMMLAIPAGAFETASDSVELLIQEALTPMDIIKAGLSTTSNGELLQTAGMFSLRAFNGDKELDWKKEIKVLVPTEEVNRNMMLFDGEMQEDGTINWVSPQRLFTELQTVDMSLLDFYPENYIPTMASLGENITDKRYTDSVYYSFSGYSKPGRLESILDVLWAQSPFGFEAHVIEGNTVYDTLKNVAWLARDTSIVVPPSESNELDPSRIKAIWNKEFNGTILATKEFEERIRFIHTTCEPKYLEAYVGHLNWQMYQVDSLCMTLAEGADKEQFRKFYERREGGVPVSSELEEKLQARYQQKQGAWKEAMTKLWNEHHAELDSLRNQALQKGEVFSMKEVLREETVFQEELCRNLWDAARQLGTTADCERPDPNHYRVNLTSPGWKNLDQYVYESTANRESMNYTDPYSGEKVTLTYTPVELTIENEANYDRVLVYLLPDSLSTFQRVLKKEGTWKEKLNSNLKYQLLVVAYKGEDVFYEKRSKLTPGKYSISLKAGSEKEIEKWLEKRPFATKASALKEELEYRRFEVNEAKRMKRVMEEAAWRETIAGSIFPCMPVGPPPQAPVENPPPYQPSATPMPGEG